jgi:serine/threonine protein kinase
VPLVGVYTTEAHPFGLVYEYMDNLDLKQYFRSEHNVGRLKLVPTPPIPICYSSDPPPQQLIEIAKCLRQMHDLNIVHGNLQAVRPFSVSHTRITQLMFASRLRQTYWSTRTVLLASVGSATCPFFPTPHLGRWRAESVPADFLAAVLQNRFGRKNQKAYLTIRFLPRPAICTLSGLSLGRCGRALFYNVVRFTHYRQVLTGRPPFADMTEIAATYSMLNGARPLRPNHCPISDRVWEMIERCWHNVPLERMSVGEAVGLLEAELQQASDYSALPHAQ